MAGLHDRRAGAGIGPIGKVNTVLILDDVFDAHTVGPGDRQHFVGTGKEIVYVAVGTHQRAHLLARIRVPVDALGFESRVHGWIGDDQAHGPGLVTVGAADRVGDARGHVGEKFGVICYHAHLCPQVRVIRGFTGIAGGVRGGGDALGGLDIDQGIFVAARLVVVLAEGKPGEQDDQARVQGQVGELGRTTVHRGGIVVGSLEQARIFIRVVQAPDG